MRLIDGVFISKCCKKTIAKIFNESRFEGIPMQIYKSNTSHTLYHFRTTSSYRGIQFKNGDEFANYWKSVEDVTDQLFLA